MRRSGRLTAIPVAVPQLRPAAIIRAMPVHRWCSRRAAALKAARLECGIEKGSRPSCARLRHAPAGAGNGPAPQIQSLLGHSHKATPQPAYAHINQGWSAITPAIALKRC